MGGPSLISKPILPKKNLLSSVTLPPKNSLAAPASLAPMKPSGPRQSQGRKVSPVTKRLYLRATAEPKIFKLSQSGAKCDRGYLLFIRMVVSRCI